MEGTYLLSGIKSECCGCSACVDVCPVKCLSMKYDEYGFIYPQKDAMKCINCGKCIKVCPMAHVKLNDDMFHSAKKTYYAVGQSAIDSTSGGVFTELAKVVLKQGGCVFGCKLNEDFVAEHIMIEKEDDLHRIRGSKYLQSNLSGCYDMVKKQLTAKRMVLFVGTPCQVAGLYGFLGKKYDNLITVDIFCHGVPSKAVFDGWIIESEKKLDGKISEIKFRSKNRFGWQHCISYTVTKSNGRKIVKNELPGENPFYFFFLYGFIMRNSCNQCFFSQQKRVGDISLGDCWSISTKSNLSVDNILKGISFVMCNTRKGQELFEKAKYDVVVPYSLKKEVQYNSALTKKTLPRNLTEEVLSNGIFSSYKQFVTRKVLIKEKIKRMLPLKVYFLLGRK